MSSIATPDGHLKKRIDQLLVEKGLAESRTRAQALIMAGLVYHGTLRLDKASITLDDTAAIEVKGKDHPYVSRGGLKLAAALDHFHINPAGFTALDVGASTGGFTDVLLLRGAAKVFAVDVGTNQLAWKLRQDARVVVMEQTNARTLTSALIPEPVDLVVCDASFISLQLVLPSALALARPGAFLAALIKPQFEVGKGNIGKGGIVTDPAMHEAVCAKISTWLADEMHWKVEGLTPSPILGAEGNREFLIGARKPD